MLEKAKGKVENDLLQDAKRTQWEEIHDLLYKNIVQNHGSYGGQVI
jgi:hypothetical protein